MAAEEKIAFRVGDGNLPPVLEIWIPSRECFVLGKYYAKRLKKKGLMDKVKSLGIPIVLRSSGGEAILHDSTCLNFGVIVPRKFLSGSIDIGKAFTLLSSGVVEVLKKMKIAVCCGKAKTFCPGFYDILVEDKKIAGISLLLRKNFCLVHGTLLVNSDRKYFEKLKIFYPSIDEEATSLRNLKGKKMDINKLITTIIQGYRKS
ncbi:lipoate--protein ligase family protein, partial [Candidatus Aerophobetes bacterium]|nr:lipoate--protein ligase family protein [Candidatus Aerophobetes bacterium]